MSDTKTMNLTSLVTKKTRRAKARLLQNFGKADKTTDELFEVYQINFNRQQTTALNLQKHVKHYVYCLKELHEASKYLSQCLLDMHEKDWPKHDVYENNAYELDHINDDLEEKLKESVLVPLEQYLGQFAEMREKIAKRGRKLVDYDSQRHTFEALQQSQVNKQHDDSKLNKSRDQLDEARRVYEALNNELHDELPALYDNRLPFIITVFQRLFSSKVSYHSDSLATQKSYLETVEHLARATEKGSLNSGSSGHSTHASLTSSKIIQPPATTNQAITSYDITNKQSNVTVTNSNNNTSIGVQSKSQPNGTNNNANAINDTKTTTSGSAETMTTTTPTTKTTGDGNGNDQKQAAAAQQVDTITSSTSSTQNPPVYLHKVCATFKYLAEDEDELSFEAGEIIQVIEYDDPSEQEEGWLMGIKESNGQKGLFPANFTKAI